MESNMKHIGAILFTIGFFMIVGTVGHIEVNEVIDWYAILQYTLIGGLLMHIGNKVMYGSE
tara:strand:- start:865 stop:1047 length:183 start_codon:yes stop_codon:yes gene_type:complete